MDGTVVKRKSRKKSKLRSSEIDLPDYLRHVSHMGWDSKNGYNLDKVEPWLKWFFEKANLTEEQLHKPRVAQFIHDFIESQGGVEKVKLEYLETLKQTEQNQETHLNSGQVKYKALYNYTATAHSEVSFITNDIIIDCIEQYSNDWALGTVERTGERGFIPSSYIRKL